MARHVGLPSRRLEILLSADVVVCGGGMAGVAACVAAARTGAKVILLEQAGCLGGLGTAGLVPCFCPYTDGDKVIARGIAEEVLVEMARRMGRPVEYDWMPIHPEVLKSVLDDLVASSGIVSRVFTRIVDVKGSGSLDAVVISTHDGLKCIRGKVFVDATGDAGVAAWAGAPFDVGDEGGRTQAATLCFDFANVDWPEYDKHRKPAGARPDQLIWKKHVRNGTAPHPDAHLTTGILKIAPGMAGLNVGHVYGVDPLDEDSLTRGIIEGRRIAWKFLDWYRTNVPGCRHAQLAATGAILGVRESRRVLGEYVLTSNDYVARAGFDDEIGRCAYPIDVHSSTPGAKAVLETQRRYHDTAYKPGESYGIPYRCLVPRKVENLLVAGRSVSSDRSVQGSLRVMPYCFVTGQAAGVAAALAAKSPSHDVRQVKIRRLQSVLRGQGSYLPDH